MQFLNFYFLLLNFCMKPLIAFFYQKPRALMGFSIHSLFEYIQAGMPATVRHVQHISKYESKGFFPRLYNVIEASRRQGDVNHIVGDVHFLALGLSKKKTVLTIHDVGFMKHPNKWARKLLYLFWLKWPVQSVAVVTVISSETKKEVLKYLPQCPPQKIRVVPNFISEKFTYVPKPLNKTGPQVLMIGTAFNKNVENSIKALQGLQCRLMIIGKLSDAHLQLLKDGNIDYTNRYNVPVDDVVQLYRDCDVLLFASFLEGFGLPILEAQATGRPVITSNLSSMPEVSGEGAHYVDPHNIESIKEGVQKILGDEAYYNDLVQKGLVNAGRFTRAATVEGYLNVYRELLQKDGKEVNF